MASGEEGQSNWGRLMGWRWGGGRKGVRGKGGLVKEVGGVDISLSGYLALQKHVVLLSFPFPFLPLEA